MRDRRVEAHACGSFVDWQVRWCEGDMPSGPEYGIMSHPVPALAPEAPGFTAAIGRLDGLIPLPESAVSMLGYSISSAP